MLTSSPKILRVNQATFFNLISLAVIDEYDKGSVMEISTVFAYVYHVACRTVL